MAKPGKNAYGLIPHRGTGHWPDWWRWLALAAVLGWGLHVSAQGTRDVAAALGQEGRFWPWQVYAWGEEYRGSQLVDPLVDRTYLLGVGLPLAALLALIYWDAGRGQLKASEDLHGSAHWATPREIKRMGYLGGHGLYVGGWFDGRKNRLYYLRHDGPEHVMCFAPTRAGKGIGLILPTLLSWPHSSVVLDIKGENFAFTSGYMASAGHKVLRFDPSDDTGASAAFNPLAEIDLDSIKCVQDVQRLAVMVMDPEGEGLKDYWGKAGNAFMGAAILHCLVKTRHGEKRCASFHDLALMLEDPQRPVGVLLKEMLAMGHASMLGDSEVGAAAHQFIASGAQGMLAKEDKERSGVVNTATSNLSLYKDPVVAMNVARSDFRVEDLMNHECPVNLYLVISPADIGRLKPLLRIVVAQILGQLTRQMEFEGGAVKAHYKHKLLLMFDEFTSLGMLPIVEQAIAYMAGYGLKGYFIVQDTTQLRKQYGPDNAIMSNCHVRIAYHPNNPETARYLSDILGTTTVPQEKVSLSGGGRGRSRSVSMAETARPLLTPDECMRLASLELDSHGRPEGGDIVVMTAGYPPIYGRQMLYFADPVFSRRSKIPAPGLSEEWPSGLSQSLHYKMPLKRDPGQWVPLGKQIGNVTEESVCQGFLKP